MIARRYSSVLLVSTLLVIGGAPKASAEEAPDPAGGPELGHEIALGLTGVYDVGYDRGLHYGLSYELSWSMLRVGALLVLGDTDPRSEQQWAINVGVRPWSTVRFDVALRHRSYPDVGFGDNLVTIISRVDWRGLELAAGLVLRFPLLDRDRLHNPFVFDRELFEHFITFRIGYVYRFSNGIGIGLLAASFSRFEVHNLDYPQAALVFSWDNERIGHFRLDAGVGIAGFFNQGATIDRGFVRIEYVRAFRPSPRRNADDDDGGSP